MLKKRLIASVIIKEDLVVQSFGYKKYLPIGDPAIVIKNLERWGIDEIILLSIDRTKKNLGPDFNLLEKIYQSALSTPIAYGGGIRNEFEAKEVIKSGAERIVLENLLFTPNKVKEISLNLGSQALIASLNLFIKNEKLYIFNNKKESYIEFTGEFVEFLNMGYFSEIYCIDRNNDGGINSFNINLAKKLSILNSKLIFTGGLTDINSINNLLKNEKCAGIALGNTLNYKEHAVQSLKQKIKSKKLRKEFFNKEI